MASLRGALEALRPFLSPALVLAVVVVALAPERRFVPEIPSTPAEDGRPTTFPKMWSSTTEKAESLEKMRMALDEFDRRIDMARRDEESAADRARRKELIEKLQRAKVALRERIADREQSERRTG